MKEQLTDIQQRVYSIQVALSSLKEELQMMLRPLVEPPYKREIDKFKDSPIPLDQMPDTIRKEYLNWYENHRRAVEEYNNLRDPEKAFLLAWKTRDPVPTAREVLDAVTVTPAQKQAMDRYKAWLKEIRKLADDIEPNKPRQDALTALKLGPVMTIEELLKLYNTQQVTTMEYIKWLKQLANLYNQWVAVKEPPPPKLPFAEAKKALELIARRLTFKGQKLEFQPKGAKSYTKPRDAKVVPLSTLKALADNATEFANLEKILAQFPYTIWRDPNDRPWINSTADYNILILHDDGLFYLRTYSKE